MVLAFWWRTPARSKVKRAVYGLSLNVQKSVSGHRRSHSREARVPMRGAQLAETLH